MEENQFNAPRKLRKIKRPKSPDAQPTSYGVPSKINAADTPNNPNDFYFADEGDIENIRFVAEGSDYNDQQENIRDILKSKTTILLMVLSVMIGSVIGATIFSSQKSAAKRGLDGVVLNSDVPSGRSRCGLVEPYQGCVLYIMNPRNKEVQGKDFFATAAQWTQRERYLIETGNMHYSSTRIKPGYIAQINIPPLSYK